MLDHEIALALQSVPTIPEGDLSAELEPETLEREVPDLAEQPGEIHAAGTDLRRDPRRELSRRIIALGDEAARVLIGRDVSSGGMRIEPTPGLGVGDILRVALHVRPDGQPLVVSARVRRDDGAGGLALRFTGLNEAARLCLEDMLVTLPAIVDSNDPDDPDAGSGMVVSEVIGRRAS
jgi:hypothetical protein